MSFFTEKERGNILEQLTEHLKSRDVKLFPAVIQERLQMTVQTQFTQSDFPGSTPLLELGAPAVISTPAVSK